VKRIQANYDVIISGAGPVGLFLACELAQRNCSVLILEKEVDPQSPVKQIPFGIRGLSSLSVEALDCRGLLDQLEVPKRIKDPHKNLTTQERRPVGHFAGISFFEDNVQNSQWKTRLPSSTPTVMISEMQELETVFAKRAQELGIEIKRGFPVRHFEQSEDSVTVQAGNEIFQTKYLVGCDGGRSFIRKSAGFEFAGTEPEFTGYSVAAEIEGSEKLKPGRNPTSKGMYLQSQPGYIVIQEFDGGKFHGQEITKEHIQEVLRRVSETDVTVKTLHYATTWTDRARQATKYKKGRVLLAGDAAHIHAPLGGQGLNLGLGDAMNLGWKLAATIKEKAPAGLLDTYEQERQPIGEKVLEWSRAQVEIMKPTPESKALYQIMKDLINTNDGATYVAGRVWGIGTSYNLGENPLEGQSTPNFQLEEKTIGEHLRSGEAILLDFNQNEERKSLAEKYGVKYLPTKTKNNLNIEATLIRPDGIISWLHSISDSPNNEKLKASLSKYFKTNE
jgi:2-polyprenyl-6-methoxyphenol hydroxylase-like FAD-dependent oxidoreductase